MSDGSMPTCISDEREHEHQHQHEREHVQEHEHVLTYDVMCVRIPSL